MSTEIITARGARLRIIDTAETHLGPAVLLQLSMVDPGDTRRAEVHIDPDALAALHAALGAAL